MTKRGLQISPDALYQEIGGEAVILDLASSTYFGLDPLGVRIWQLLQGNTDEQGICNVLLEEYEVEPDQLKKDIETFLGQLLAAGLVSVADA